MKRRPRTKPSSHQISTERRSNQPIVSCYVKTARVFVCSQIDWNIREPSRMQMVVLIYFFSYFHISAANCRIWWWKWWRCRSCFLSFSYGQTKKEVTQVHLVCRCFISLRTSVGRTATECFTESWCKTELRFGDVNFKFKRQPLVLKKDTIFFMIFSNYCALSRVCLRFLFCFM